MIDDRPRVRDVGEQRAERDDHLHAERLGELDDRRAERPPAHRRLDAGEQDQVARRARDARLVDLDLGPRDLARAALDEPDPRARGLEVEELLGVDRAKRVASSERADERQRGRGAASPASFQPLNAHTSAGARRPSGRRSQMQRLHPIHGTSMGALGAHAGDNRADQVATLRAGDEIDGVFACTRKDRLMARSGSPYLALELRDRTRRDPGARVPRRRRAGRALRARRPRARAPAASSASATSSRSRCARSRAPRRRPTRPRSCRSPTATSTSSRASSSTWRARCTTAALRGAARALLGDASCAPGCAARPCTRAGHHAYLGGLLEHTVAVATLALELCQLHPRLDSDLLITAAIVHDLGKTREFTYGAEIGLTDEGRLLGHSRSASAIVEAHAGGAGEARRLALLHCVLCHHGADAAPGRRFGSAEALALYRLNALDASVKGAFEQGL